MKGRYVNMTMKNIMDMTIRRKKVIRHARLIGCDWDGDVFYYDGRKYYIDMIHNILKPAN